MIMYRIAGATRWYCDNFLHSFKGVPPARQRALGDRPRSTAWGPALTAVATTWCGHWWREGPGGSGGHLADSGAAASRALWATARRARHCRRWAGPHPQPRACRRYASVNGAAAAQGRAHPSVPGILSPHKITVKCAAARHT